MVDVTTISETRIKHKLLLASQKLYFINKVDANHSVACSEVLECLGVPVSTLTTNGELKHHTPEIFR
jgi:hypothetical protein